MVGGGVGWGPGGWGWVGWWGGRETGLGAGEAEGRGGEHKELACSLSPEAQPRVDGPIQPCPHPPTTQIAQAVENKRKADDITAVLYPNDGTALGKELRLKQQFFFVSASLQDTIARFTAGHPGAGLEGLPEKAVFQMNDTHPTIAVAELMRLLVDEHGLAWDAAWAITGKSLAYTNHT